MQLTFSFPKEFDDLITSINPKLLALDGIDADGLDFNLIAKSFFGKDQTISVVDPNSNVAARDAVTFTREATKPYFKLNSIYNLWKVLKEEFGLERANKIMRSALEGASYINDVTGADRPYCFNYSTNDVFMQGLKMANNKLHISRPKSLMSFLRQVEQFVSYASNATLGAVGLADLLLVVSVYVDGIKNTGKDGHITIKEDEIDTYVYEKLTSFIYTMNWQFRGAESPFTNLSLYDSYFLDDLLPFYGDGTPPKKETVQHVQELFMNAYTDALRRTPITFPIITGCLSVERDENGKRVAKDGKFRDMLAKANLPFGSINIYSGETSTLSSCCFDGNQKVLVNASAIPQLITLKELAELPYERRTNLSVFHRGEWREARPVVLPARPMYKVTTSNGKSIVVTDNHVHVTDKGDVDTVTLSTDHYLAFNTRALTTELDKSLFPEHGVVEADENMVRIGDSEDVYFKVTSIEPVEYDSPYVYCLEMQNQDEPYFTLPNGIITHNCRLRSNMNDLGVSNSLGSGSVKIGSIGVVTLNLPYIWYKAGRPKGIYAYIASMKEQARNACYINHAKRQYVKKRIDEGALPLYTHGYMDLSRQYSTIGFTGMAEVVTKLGYEDLEERTEAMAQLLTALNEVCDECNEKFKAPHNVEQTPSESSAVKLSKKTKVMFEDAKDDVAFYSNQFIPLTQDVDIADRIYAQGKLDQLCSGGSILHLNIGEPITDARVMADLIDDVIASGCMYFAVNYRLHKCVNNHMSAGGTEKDKCPICGEAITDSYTRVVGFLTNVKNWNKTRQKLDYPNRVFK